MFTSLRDGSANIYWKPVARSAEAEILSSRDGGGYLHPSSWTPDGETLVFYGWGPATSADLGLLSKTGEHESFLSTPALEWSAAFSPYGRWIAFTSDQGGEHQLFVRPYPANDREIPISADYGAEPVWSRDGSELFYDAGPRGILAVEIETEGDELRVGTTRTVYRGHWINVHGRSFQVGADGRVLVMKPVESFDPVGRIELVQNWFDELERLVPTK